MEPSSEYKVAEKVGLSHTPIQHIWNFEFQHDTVQAPSKNQKLMDSEGLRSTTETHSKIYSKSSYIPSKKKLKRWSSEEDKKLIELFYAHSNDWKKIAENMPGRAASGVKNRFYCICKNSLPTQTVQKIKHVYCIKKLYKAPFQSSELFRKINDYIWEECVVESFLDLDKPAPYTDLLYKLKMTPQDLENHNRMQILLEKAQTLYISCKQAKENLAFLQKIKLEQS